MDNWPWEVKKVLSASEAYGLQLIGSNVHRSGPQISLCTLCMHNMASFPTLVAVR